MQAARADRASALRRHWRGAAAVVVVAALVHALALSGLEWAWPQREPAPPPALAMQVRVLVAAPVEAVTDALPPVPTVPQVTQVPQVPATPSRPARPRVAAALRAEPVHVRIAAAPMPAAVVAVAAPEPPSALPAPAEDAIPLYPTQMPPAVLMRYQVRRGGLQGTGELRWRPQGERYELDFDARIGPLSLLAQSSTGGFDAAGIAPLRFTDQRARRPVQAVNFQREAGKVSFSGTGTEFALRAGMQDRLSWMMQLAAIVAAEPALRVAGAKVALRVVGAQGDASVWVFGCLGTATAVGTLSDEGEALPGGLLAYLREPRELYDTTVKVWLDPAHHHLPVRARSKAGPGDPGLALVLQDLQPLP